MSEIRIRPATQADVPTIVDFNMALALESEHKWLDPELVRSGVSRGLSHPELCGYFMAEIDGQDHEVGPGDFMGFPTPSVAHHLRNPFDEALVYLMGGESREFEVADYPKLGKRAVRRGARASVYPLTAGEPFPYPGIEPL